MVRRRSAVPEPRVARVESEIFADLETLCTSCGFIHALSAFVFRDSLVGFGEALTAKDMLQMYRDSRLIRTELSTLAGLMMRKAVDFSLPKPETLDEYMQKARVLLEELYQSMTLTFAAQLTPEALAVPNFNPFASASALREPIFYGAESAYQSQYRDLAGQKYGADSSWLIATKGFTIEEAVSVYSDAHKALEEKRIPSLKAFREKPSDEWTTLPIFTITVAEISKLSKLSADKITQVLDAFSLRPDSGNPSFNSLSEYNAFNAYPVLRRADGEYVILMEGSLVEALYETPFYWMSADKSYSAKASKHRGDYAELFSLARLEKVFGKTRVHRGVKIFKGKGKEIGKIDVLVLFGDRAIILQAKSKRLTIEAKKGNDLQLLGDFKAAVQDANDQAHICAIALRDASLEFRDQDDNLLKIELPIEEIFPICVVADHYPALAFQARQFLKTEKAPGVAAPLITDVFLLDAMTEMLDSPLRLLSYLGLKAKFGDQLFASGELTFLSYHLKRNLWLEDGYNMMLLHDDVGADLDVAMAVRRDGVPGKATPDGILTRMENTWFGRLIKGLEQSPNPAALALGLAMLQLAEQTIEQINAGVEKIVGMAAASNRSHDFTIAFGETGLTIHCNDDSFLIANPKLVEHCERRKYILRSDSWLGLLIGSTGSVRLALQIAKPWKLDPNLEAITAAARKKDSQSRKPGRNSPCPCRSGKKYKKCCL